jgi:hypothetical protein
MIDVGIVVRLENSASFRMVGNSEVVAEVVVGPGKRASRTSWL